MTHLKEIRMQYTTQHNTTQHNTTQRIDYYVNGLKQLRIS
jgi:hypothetical protein